MAQAARLNLRMQKELKLLMTDPPPGISLPLLSDNDNNLVSSSLTSIDARIEGPEGTVYAKGIFTVRIQIPERYPFQPPNVTFITPIYHPNIDNGGRICLDILNLPPKGAWQPSLNISTVLTSIGLLLSEPNPDDGLMAEASREYKYNRQAFDQKARSWTDMYANAGAIGRSNNDVMSANQSMKEVEKEDVSLENVDEIEGSRKKLQLGEKLSLKSAVPVKTNCSNNKENIKLQPGEKLSVKPAIPGKTNCSNNKENLPPRRLSISCSQNHPPIGMKCDNKPPHEYTRKAVNQKLKPEGGQSNNIETIIVSDSEDSDEEIIRNSRLRFPLMRKQLIGKRKGMD